MPEIDTMLSAEANYASRDNIVRPAVLDPDGNVVYAPLTGFAPLVEADDVVPVATVPVVPTVE